MFRSITVTLGLLISCTSFAQINNSFYGSQHTRNNTRVNENALQICRDMMSDSRSNECVSVVQSARFSNKAVAFCGEQFSDSNKNQCLREIANQGFQKEAIELCTNLFSSSSQNQCIGTIANKYYDPRLLNICSEKFSDSNIINCLQRLDYQRLDNGWTHSGSQDGSIDLSIIVDLGRVIIRGEVNLPQSGDSCYNCHDEYTYNHERNRPVQAFCTVRETGDGMNSAADFYRWVSLQANRQNRCAVGHLGQTDRSTRIYDGGGRRMDNGSTGVTYKEAAEIKRANSLRGCSDYICQ